MCPNTRFHGNHCNTVKQSFIKMTKQNEGIHKSITVYINWATVHRLRHLLWVTFNTKTVWRLFITDALISFMFIWRTLENSVALYLALRNVFVHRETVPVLRSVILAGGQAIFKGHRFLRHYSWLASLSQKHNFSPLPFF